MPTCQYIFKSRTVGSSGNPISGYACNEQTNGKFCIFHDKEHSAENEKIVIKRFEEKLKESLSKKEPLSFAGCYLPDIDFAKLIPDKTFPYPVNFIDTTFYQGVNFSGFAFSGGGFFMDATFLGEITNFSDTTFSGFAFFTSARFSSETRFPRAEFSGQTNFFDCTFCNEVDFRNARFCREVDFTKVIFNQNAFFYDAKFGEKAYFKQVTFLQDAFFSKAIFTDELSFSLSKFLKGATFEENVFAGETRFLRVLFEQPRTVIFDDIDLSNVSFADSDVTRIRFGNGIIWRGDDRLTIIEEEWLTHKIKENNSKYRSISLGLVLSIYRNLRESYEFELRYNEAGRFFIKEMELKRKYREIRTEKNTETKKNGWLRRNFSLTGLYYHLSRYGESISRPTLIGAITVILSTLFWLTQSNPTLEPHFYPSAEPDITSTFIGFREIYNGTQWLKSFERSFLDFLPLLPAGDFKVGIIDFIIKIAGGALTFGLLLIAFRRKFERKYTR